MEITNCLNITPTQMPQSPYNFNDNPTLSIFFAIIPVALFALVVILIALKHEEGKQ